MNLFYFFFTTKSWGAFVAILLDDSSVYSEILVFLYISKQLLSQGPLGASRPPVLPNCLVNTNEWEKVGQEIWLLLQHAAGTWWGSVHVPGGSKAFLKDFSRPGKTKTRKVCFSSISSSGIYFLSIWKWLGVGTGRTKTKETSQICSPNSNYQYIFIHCIWWRPVFGYRESVTYCYLRINLESRPSLICILAWCIAELQGSFLWMNFYSLCYQSVILKDINFVSSLEDQVVFFVVVYFCLFVFFKIAPKTIIIIPLQQEWLPLT